MAQTHEKVWGTEIWYVNQARYCLKRLIVNPGFRCSWHRHLLKDETFVCETGFGYVDIEMDVRGTMTLQSIHMQTGTTVHIPTGTWHRFRSLNGMTMLEVSTHHSDFDVERRDQSGEI